MARQRNPVIIRPSQRRQQSKVQREQSKQRALIVAGENGRPLVDRTIQILNENDLETYNLSEVDSMILNKEQKKLTPAHLQEFIDQLKELQKHSVFRGRSFVQEGTYFYDDEEEVQVVFNWSS